MGGFRKLPVQFTTMNERQRGRQDIHLFRRLLPVIRVKYLLEVWQYSPSMHRCEIYSMSGIWLNYNSVYFGHFATPPGLGEN